MARRASSDVNLAAIARELGVSVSTASRALRGAEGIHPDTREKIIRTAEELGYDMRRRHMPAVTASPHHVMALAQCDSATSDQGYLAGMSRASVKLNLAILSHHVPVSECNTLLDAKLQPTGLRMGMVEGLVLIHRWPPEVAKALSERWPTVSIIHSYAGTNIDQIGINDLQGMHLVVDHLLAGGYKRIGFFGFCLEMSWACTRFGAFVAALASRGIMVNSSDVVPVSLADALKSGSFEPGEWTRPILDRMNAGVDAWVCPSTAVAQSLCRFIMDRGIPIPAKVGVTGYHHNVHPAPELPPLTSTIIADEELGAAALRRLLHRFEHPDEAQRCILLPARIFQGKTTREPAHA